MENTTKQWADEYVELLDYLTAKVGNSDLAAEIAEWIGKDRRAAAIGDRAGNGFRGNGNGKRVVHGDEPATEAQLSLLSRLKVPVEEGKPLTRQAASDLIDQARR